MLPFRWHIGNYCYEDKKLKIVFTCCVFVVFLLFQNFSLRREGGVDAVIVRMNRLSY
jgi:hypothetical protein